MSFLTYVRRNLTQLPAPVGRLASRVPYAWRPGLGSIYRERQRQIARFDAATAQRRRELVFERVQAIAAFAYRHVPFYGELYRAHGVDPQRFGCLEDLRHLPIVDKAMLQAVPLAHRSCPQPGSYVVNTGGSSGNTLEFLIDPTSIGHEWAHMHTVWGMLGFRPSDLRVVFAGRSDVRDVVMYDSARHQINVDIYAGWPAVADRLLALFDRYAPTYLHGYPSSIFDFVQWLDEHAHPLLARMRGRIRGMFLGSEYPAPPLRAATERLLGCRSVSWYGHTERALLAYERSQPGRYEPFHTYGFAEAVGSEGLDRLLCTGYYGRASPFIRYDTGDLVEGTTVDGLLESFTIREGRSGEYVIDAHGRKIFLTALVFGRHHRCFDYCSHIQLKQERPGQVTVFCVPRKGAPQEGFADDFDASNVALEFEFRRAEQPFRTASGKVPLLIR